MKPKYGLRCHAPSPLEKVPYGHCSPYTTTAFNVAQYVLGDCLYTQVHHVTAYLQVIAEPSEYFSEYVEWSVQDQTAVHFEGHEKYVHREYDVLPVHSWKVPRNVTFARNHY